MDTQRKTWGLKRFIYLAVGVIMAIGAVVSFVPQPSAQTIALLILALVALSIPLLASDALLDKFNRTAFNPFELFRK